MTCLLLLLLMITTFATASIHATELLTAAPQDSLEAEVINDEVVADNVTTTSDVEDANNRTNHAGPTISTAEQPFLVEHAKALAIKPINQTHMEILLEGNRTLMPPNSTETIETKDTGSAIIRLISTGNIAQGRIVIETKDGSENGTVFFTEIGRNENGIGVAYFTTNSTGKLAFLNNIVTFLESETQPNGSTVITAWEWIGQKNGSAITLFLLDFSDFDISKQKTHMIVSCKFLGFILLFQLLFWQ